MNAAARSLRAAHQSTQLMTIHPGVARTSSTDFHLEPWLDFNLLQSGHLIDSTAHGLPENHTLIANKQGAGGRMPPASRLRLFHLGNTTVSMT